MASKKIIVKIKLPKSKLQDEALVYTKNRSLDKKADITPELLGLFDFEKDEREIYAEALYDKAGGIVTVKRKLPAENW